MLKKYMKKSMVLLMLILTIVSTFSNLVFATEISSAVVRNGGECGYHLQFFDTDQNIWSYIITHYAYYEEGSCQYPAYCLDKDVSGVGTPEAGDSYTVNINEVMNDVRLWRVVINGYPYQSPKSMGVANNLDAFVATKQAVYSIIYDRDPSTFYRGGDEQGEAIKNAVVGLVNIGKYGSQTPYNTNITVTKTGEFYEDGEYYSQEYTVNSPVETSIYSIVSTAGMPNGSIITNLSNVESSVFNGNEHFKVKVPKSQLSSDINITVVVKAKCKTYPVFYGRTTVPGTQDYMLTFDPFGDLSGQTTLNVKTNTGVIKIVKTDDETHKAIEGVTFQLSKEDGTVIANATTNKDGIAAFSSLYRGKYILKETATNEKYILNTKEFEVDVEYNKTTTVDIENEHKKGNVKVYKIDKDNNRVVLGNVEFQLYSHEFERVIGTYYTDVDGELLIKDLRIGDYSLIETKTNKWYNLADDTGVEIEWNLTKELQIENELKKGAIKIIKVDKDDNEVKLENVKFNVMDKDRNILEQLTTDKNGEAQTSRYAVRDISELKIQEVETLDNYVLDNEVRTIVLEENQIKNVKFENEKIKGQIQITKVSKDDNKLTGDKKGTAIVGAEFQIYDKDNNLVDTVTTDNNGIALSKELLKGKYTIKETKAPTYYLVNQNTFNAEIINHKEIVNVDIEDESVDIKVEVEKTGFKETQSKDTIYYDFNNIKNNSNVYLDTFNWQDTIPTNALRLEKIFTGTWNQKLKYSVWYKTNLNDYRVIREELDTEKNYEIDMTNIGLQDEEYVTEYEFRFGKVDIGFREVEKPRIYCKVLDDLKNGFTFTNTTKVYGTYLDKYVEDNDKWVTVIYNKDLQLTKLPNTGF